jgi:hypothetical protein
MAYYHSSAHGNIPFFVAEIQIFTLFGIKMIKLLAPISHYLLCSVVIEILEIFNCLFSKLHMES